MKALVFDGNLALKEIPAPKTAPGESLVRVRAAGICNTDVEITRGYMDFSGILGHEFVGTVESSPDERLVGSRVVGEINAGCGQCTFCRKGLQRHCPDRTVLGILGRNGALAEYLTLPEANLIRVPDGIPDEKAVFTEPLAAAVEILEQVAIRPADSVLIIGDGKLGMLIGMVLRLIGSDLLVVGKHAEKLEIWKGMGGETVLLDQLESTTDRFDVVVEASGHPSGWALATRKVKPRGIIVLKSTYHGALDFNAAPLVIDEITVVGSRCGPFAPAVRMMNAGLVDPLPLLTATFSLQDGEEAFRKAQEKETLKVVLKM